MFSDFAHCLNHSYKSHKLLWVVAALVLSSFVIEFFATLWERIKKDTQKQWERKYRDIIGHINFKACELAVRINNKIWKSWRVKIIYWSLEGQIRNLLSIRGYTGN